MNKHWVFYDQYGWITKNMDCPDEIAQDNVKEGESLLEVEQQSNPEKFYVKDATVVQREPFLDVTVSENPTVNSTITVSNVPENTEVIWHDGVRTRETGSFTFETDVAGSFTLLLTAPAYYPNHNKVDIDVT